MISLSPSGATESQLPELFHHVRTWIIEHWFALFVAFALLYLFTDREFSIQFRLYDAPVATNERLPAPRAVRTAALPTVPAPKVNSKPPAATARPTIPTAAATPAAPSRRVFRHSDYQDLQFLLEPDYATRHQLPRDLVDAKLDACRAYVTRFAKTAIAEKARYNVPVAIKLAQGLLESENGKNPLAVAANNHFALPCGISPDATGCLPAQRYGHTAEFQRFDAPWNSFRMHSLLLNSDQYSHLLRLPAKDYKAWARGLQMAGYSPDPNYADKLVKVIEGLELFLFDR